MNEYFHHERYKRIEEMFLYRQLGMSLAKIGKKYDLTPERVRQILSKRERMAKWNYLNSEPDKNFLSPYAESKIGAAWRVHRLQHWVTA